MTGKGPINSGRNAPAACPGEEAVFALLDADRDVGVDRDIGAGGGASVEASGAGEVRAHVAECETCLARFGPLFELELLAPEMTGANAPTLPLAPWRGFERVAVAAVLILAAGLAARVRWVETPAPPHPADARLLALSLSESTCDRDGCFEIRRTLAPGSPAFVHVEEIRTDAEGIVLVHERTLPLAAAAME